jgi:hypothetical protein
MAIEIFNPNPTIFAPVKPAKSSRTDSLWVNDASDSRADADDVEAEELIDQDEVFGTSNQLRPSSSTHRNPPG